MVNLNLKPFPWRFHDERYEICKRNNKIQLEHTYSSANWKPLFAPWTTGDTDIGTVGSQILWFLFNCACLWHYERTNASTIPSASAVHTFAFSAHVKYILQ